MIPAVSSLLSVASLWTALQGTVGESASVRGSVNTDPLTCGDTTQTSGCGRKELDLNVGPAIFMGLRDGRFAYTLGYRPNLTWRDLLRADDRDFFVMHGAYASLGYTGLGYSLTLGQFVSIGEQSYWTQPLNGVPGAAVDPTVPRTQLFPAAKTLLTAGEGTTAAFTYQWSARWSSAMNASYSISGGLDRQARMLLPQTKAATGGFSTSYRLDRQDSVGGDLTIANYSARTATTSTSGAWTLTGAGRFNRVFAEGLTGGASLGTTAVRNPRPGGGADYSLNLTGNASLGMNLVKVRDFTVNGGVGAGVGTAFGSLTGLLQQRAQGSANVSLAYQIVSLNLGADVAQTLPPSSPDAYRTVGLNVSSSVAVTQFLSLDAGYRTSWQHANAPAAGDPNAPLVAIPSYPRQWSVFFGLTLRGPVFSF